MGITIFPIPKFDFLSNKNIIIHRIANIRFKFQRNPAKGSSKPINSQKLRPQNHQFRTTEQEFFFFFFRKKKKRTHPLHQRASLASSVEEEGEGEEVEGSEGLSWKEGRGLEPLMIQPRAKKETPAKMAVPQAWEYHLLYCLMANFHCSRSVTGSGFVVSGGFGYRTFWPEKLASLLGILSEEEEDGRFWGLLGSWWWSDMVGNSWISGFLSDTL